MGSDIKTAMQVPFKKKIQIVTIALWEKEREIHNAGSELGNL